MSFAVLGTPVVLERLRNRLGELLGALAPPNHALCMCTVYWSSFSLSYLSELGAEKSHYFLASLVLAP